MHVAPGAARPLCHIPPPECQRVVSGRIIVITLADAEPFGHQCVSGRRIAVSETLTHTHALARPQL